MALRQFACTAAVFCAIAVSALAQSVVAPPVVVAPPPVFVPPVRLFIGGDLFLHPTPLPPLTPTLTPVAVVRPTFAVVQVSSGVYGSAYTVHVGDRVLQTNDVAVIISALPVAERQYLDVSMLTAKQRAAFAISAQTALAAQPSRRVRVVENAGPLVSVDALRNALVIRDMVLETNSGWYAQRADATIEETRYSFRALSRLAAAVTRFFAMLTMYFNGERANGESTFDLVHRLRREVASEYGISADDLQVEIRDGLGSSYWVDLQAPQLTHVR
jgi:hypothetical protein